MIDLSRRQFLGRSLVLGGAALAGVQLPRPRAVAAAAASGERVVLSAGEWATLEAIGARLIPTDHEPGAVEAGCVNFIDKALAHEDAALRPLYAEGVRGVDALARATGGAAFVELDAERQDAVLRAMEDDKADAWPAGGAGAQAFFAQVLTHTVWGFLADPRHGGNRDYAGWRVLGYPGGRHRRGGYSVAAMAGSEKVESVWGEPLPRQQAKDGISQS